MQPTKSLCGVSWTIVDTIPVHNQHTHTLTCLLSGANSNTQLTASVYAFISTPANCCVQSTNRYCIRCYSIVVLWAGSNEEIHCYVITANIWQSQIRHTVCTTYTDVGYKHNPRTHMLCVRSRLNHVTLMAINFIYKHQLYSMIQL